MKRMAWITIGAALLLATAAAAQSLGDVAKAVRKDKAQQTTTSRHFDNDNLPTEEHLSVVGPPPASDPNATNGQASDANAGAQPAADPSSASGASANPAATPDKDAKTSEADRQKANDDWQKKIEAAKKNIDSLSHELDITEREYRLRAVAMYSDAGNRLRNSADWDKEDADFKQQIENKQKALDQAKQQLEQLEEQARKAGVPSKQRE